MSEKAIPYHFFLCEITLKKTNFLGVINSKIIVVITSDSKILILKFSNKNVIKKFPFKESEIIDFKVLKKWIVDNKYNYEYFTKSKKLKLIVAYNLDNNVTDTNNDKTNHNFFTKAKLFIKNGFSKRKY